MTAKKKVKTAKMGRPSAYRPEFADQARDLCPAGATDPDLAAFFNVSLATISNWKLSKPDFLDALKDGKNLADGEIVDSLFKRAQGFEYEEAVPIKLKTVLYENGKRVSETERVETVMVTRVVPPDVTACIFWLKNRQTSAWRDIKAMEVTGKNGGPVQTQLWGFGDKQVTF